MVGWTVPMRCAPGPPRTRLLGPSTERDPAVLEVEQQRPVGIISEAHQRRPSRPPVGRESLKVLQRYLRVEEQPRAVFARPRTTRGPFDGWRDEDLEASFTGMDQDHGRGQARSCRATAVRRGRSGSEARGQPSASPPRWRSLERGAQPLGPRGRFGAISRPRRRECNCSRRDQSSRQMIPAAAIAATPAAATSS